MVFTEAKREIRELIVLVAEIERYDTTLAKEPHIVPSPESQAERVRKGQRMNQLMAKYELA